MIDPLQSGLSQATGWANSWSLVQSNSLGLNSTDQETHLSPAPQRFELIYSTFFRGLLRLETGNSGHKAEPVLTIVLYDLQSIRNLSRLHTETPDKRLQVPDSERRHFSSWQENQGVMRRHTSVPPRGWAVPPPRGGKGPFPDGNYLREVNNAQAQKNQDGLKE